MDEQTISQDKLVKQNVSSKKINGVSIDNLPDLLTVAEVADLLRVSKLTIKRWGPLQNIKPLTLRFDVPFFITHAPFANQKHFDFRWVVAVSRAF